MHTQSKAWKRLVRLYRQLLGRIRALERAAEHTINQRVFMRVHVEMLQPRIMMSVTPTGTETLVNTTTTYPMQNPAVAMNPAGNSVVAWTTTASGGEVLAQRYNINGSPVGGQFQVNQSPAGAQAKPSVAIDNVGDFVIAWDGLDSSAFIRVFNSSGAAITGQTLVTASLVGTSRTAVAMNASGAIVVAWEGSGAADDDGIYAQDFLVDGLASGSAFLVNTTTSGSQTNPSIAMDSAGDFVIAWTDNSTAQSTIQAAYFPSTGPTISQFAAGAEAGGAEDDSAVGIDSSGSFIIAWQTYFGGSTSWDINARGFSAGAVPATATPVVVNSVSDTSQTSASVAMRADGSNLVAWESEGQDGSGLGVYAQSFAATGALDGSEFLVNTTTSEDQQDPAAAWTGGTAVIAWDGNGAGDSTGVFLQRYTTAGAENQTPVNTIPATQVITENNRLAFSSANGNAVSISDSDADGGVEQLALTATNGTLDLSGTAGLTFSAGSNGSGAMTFTGTLAGINAALAGMVFTPTSNFVGAATVKLVTNDLGNTGIGGPASVTSSFSINVHAPPTSDTYPGGQTTAENVPLIFSPQNDNALYAGSGTDDVGLGVSSGTFTLSTTSGLTFINGTTNGSDNVEFKGTVAAMNAALDGLVFTPKSNFTGSDPLTYITAITPLDLITLFSTYTIPMTVTAPAPAVNQPPKATVPGAQTTAEGSPLVFSGGNVISVSDSDANGGSEQLTLIATSGTLTLATTTGLNFSSGTGTGNASMTFTGTLANLNAALNGLTFTPASVFYGGGGIYLAIDDLGNTGTGGAKTATATVAINITQANQPPAVAVPAAESVAENGTLAFSSAVGNSIVVSDVDADGADEQVTLSTSNGTLSLGSSTNLTIDAGGNGQSTITVTGTLPDINAALDTLTFSPTTGFVGSASVQVLADDLGNTGPGGPKTAMSFVSINVIQSLVVTTALDVDNGNTSSITNLVADPGPDGISLREAMLAVDNTPGSYVITFDIPGTGAQTISLASALPAISNAMIIDGTSQPGYSGSPLIVIDGSSLPAATDGFVVQAADSSIIALAIDNFGGDGINVSGVNGVTIQADFIGLNAAGASAPNGTGIALSNSAADVIGGSSAAQRNIISGNTGDGIDLTGAGTTGDVVGGNYIGTNPAGTAAIANGGAGISILGGASGNSIGASSLQANLAGYFNRPGIVADGSTFTEGFDGGGSAYSSTLLGNSLTWNGNAYTFGPVGSDNAVYGTGQTVALPPGFDSTLTFLGAGVYGDQPNQTFTVTYTDHSTQTFTQSLADWQTATTYTGQSVADTTSYRDTFTGGMDAGAWDLFGYSFALNSAKSIASITLPDNDHVVLLAIDTTLTVSSAGNVISGNAGYGIEVSGTSSTDNVVQGNFIGTNAAGSASISNGEDGVFLNATFGNTIGGASPADRNIISGNTDVGNAANTADGVWIDGGSSNIIQGNFIGTDVSGSVPLGNIQDGIAIVSSTDNLIGGATSGAGNVISGNGAYGIEIDGPSAGGNLVQGNFVGTNAAGSASVTNGNDGIWLNGVSGVTIGGTLAGTGNLISGNTSAGALADGIWILDGSANTVQGNSIGTDITGTANLGNFNNGVTIESSSGNQIGGTSPGAGNIIAFNNKGVDVYGSGANGNSILENSIFGNTALGIDLGNDGITANTGSLDSALSNDGMNFPVFTSATLAGNTLSVAGYIGTAPDQSAFADAQIDLFQSDGSQANGEGKTWLGMLVADSNGNFAGSFNVTSLSIGDIVTATATDSSGDTSEFSANDTIVPVPVAHTPSITNATTDENQQTNGGLVITQNMLDASTTIYFEITDITDGALFLSDGVTPLTDNDFITAAQGAAGLKFTPSADSSAPGGFDVQASLTGDAGGLGGNAVAASITVIPPPTITVQEALSTIENTPLLISAAQQNAVTVADADSNGGAEELTLNVSDGSLTIAFSPNLVFENGTGSEGATIDCIGTISDINAALNGMTYTPRTGYFGDDSLSITVNDLDNSGGTGPQTASLAIPITIAEVNEPPTVAVPPSQSAVEDTPLTFSEPASAIVISDIDADGGIEQATLSVSAGTLTMSDLSGLSFVNGTTNASSLLTVTGTLTSINAALNTLTFTAPEHFTGLVTMNVTSDDLGNTGLGGPMTATASIAINISPVAHDPSVTGASTLQDTQTSGGLVISPSPIDNGQPIWFQISNITGGTLFLSDGVTPIADGEFITAAQGQAGLKFTPATSSTSPGGFDVQASLAANATALGGSAIPATIAVIPLAAPVNTVPAVETIAENTPLIFSTAGGDAISISNSDGGTQQVTLTAADGTLTLATTAGVTLLAGTGSGDATVSFAGSPAGINAALNGLTFTPANNFTGPAMIQITSEDVTSAAAGNPLTALSSVAATVTRATVPPPPAPQIVADTGLMTEADVVATITPAVLAAAEAGAASAQLTFTLTQAPTQGTLMLAGNALHAGSTFTESDIEQGQLTYASSTARTVDDAFTFIVTDAAGVSTPSAVFQIHTVGIVAPPPLIVAPGPAVTLPAPTSPDIPPTDTTVPLNPVPVFDGGIQGGSNTSVAPSTPAALDTTTNRATSIAPVAAIPVGAILTPVFPHAPPARAADISAPALASAVRSNDVVPGDIAVPIPSRSQGHAFLPAAAGAGAVNGPFAGLGSDNGTGRQNPAKPQAAFDNSSPLWRQLDTLESQIASERKTHIVAGVASLVSVGISVAYFVWAVRAGSVLSSLLSSMPAWKLVDPLPILDQAAGGRSSRKRDGDDDDETLESMVDGKRKAA